MTGASRASSCCANDVCASSASRIPRPNSALSSNRQLAHAGPRPSALVAHGVVGRLAP